MRHFLLHFHHIVTTEIERGDNLQLNEVILI